MQHSSAPAKHTAAHHSVTLISIIWIFLRLRSTSFGAHIAHLGYLRHEFVERRRWLDGEAYADLVALCQFSNRCRSRCTYLIEHPLMFS